jgi:hypothetical protein
MMFPLRWEQWSAKALQWLQVDDFTFPFWMALITLGQLAGFVAGMVQYSQDDTVGFSYDGWTYPIAKGAGRALQVRRSTLFVCAAKRSTFWGINKN